MCVCAQPVHFYINGCLQKYNKQKKCKYMHQATTMSSFPIYKYDLKWKYCYIKWKLTIVAMSASPIHEWQQNHCRIIPNGTSLQSLTLGAFLCLNKKSRAWGWEWAAGAPYQWQTDFDWADSDTSNPSCHHRGWRMLQLSAWAGVCRESDIGDHEAK